MPETGIINAASVGQYTGPDGHIWTYFQDAGDPAIFYIVQRPGFRLVNGLPVFNITEYVDATGAFLSALCQIATALQEPPQTIKAAIAQVLQAAGIANPMYQGMPYIALGEGPEQNWAHLNFADATGAVSGSVSTVPSLSGDQQAQFNLENLTETEMAFFKAYFSGEPGAGTVEVNYDLTITAQMDGVQAHIRFDSAKAYQYQRTFKWVS